MTSSNIKRADDIEKNWILAKGKKELVSHLHGERLSATNAIKAKCYECMGGYGDEKADCMIEACPLHPMMPYNPNKKKTSRPMSEEQRKATRERLVNSLRKTRVEKE